MRILDQYTVRQVSTLSAHIGTDLTDFAYKGFVHEIEFRNLRGQGKSPSTLTLLMAANALAYVVKIDKR